MSAVDGPMKIHRITQKCEQHFTFLSPPWLEFGIPSVNTIASPLSDMITCDYFFQSLKVAMIEQELSATDSGKSSWLFGLSRFFEYFFFVQQHKNTLQAQP